MTGVQTCALPICAKSCLDPKNPIITFSGKKLVLITYLDWTYKQPDKITEDFFTIPLVSQCINKINKTLIKYADASSLFSYEAALKPHIEKYSSIFNHVSLKLNNADKALSNEELLQKQKKTDYILPELLKRVYNHGRYAMYSCAGHTDVFGTTCGGRHALCEELPQSSQEH